MNKRLMLGIVLLLVASMFVVVNAAAPIVQIFQSKPPTYDPNGDFPAVFEPPQNGFRDSGIA